MDSKETNKRSEELNQGNGEVLSAIKTIKDKAREERISYENFFAPLNEALSSFNFERENASIHHNLGIANSACQFTFTEENNPYRILSEILNEPDFRKDFSIHISQVNKEILHSMEKALCYHRSCDEAEWIKAKFPVFAPALLGKKFVYKILRPFFNVQKIFNEHLLQKIAILERLIVETGYQSFSLSIIRCLNEWVQKDIKKEHQLRNWMSNLVSTQFQFVRTELDKVKKELENIFIEKIKTLENSILSLERGINEFNNTFIDLRNRLNNESAGIRQEIDLLKTSSANNETGIQNLYKRMDLEGNSLRGEINTYKGSLENMHQRFSEESIGLRKEIESFKDIFKESVNKVSNELQENYINILKEESKGIRFELESLSEKLRADVFEAFKNSEINFENKHSNLINQLKADFEQLLMSEVEKNTKGINEFLSQLKEPKPHKKGEDKVEKKEIRGKESSLEIAEDEFDFYAFEEWSRGSEEWIRNEQSIYVPYLKRCKRIVDLGCGRGEFLEILKKEGFSAYGIDSDPRMVFHCLKKNLEVKLGDLFEHLSTLDENNIDGCFAAQVVEHLTVSELARFIKLAFQKLSPGGAIILETINPCCLSTFSGALYADPTHQRPVHPVALQFFLEKAGFSDCQIVFSIPIPPEKKLDTIDLSKVNLEENPAFLLINKNFEKLNSLLYTFAHYALVAKKPLP